MNILIANNRYTIQNNNHFNYGQTFAQYDNEYDNANNSVFLRFTTTLINSHLTII